MRRARDKDRPDQPAGGAVSLTGPAAERERRPGLRAVGAAAARLAGPVVARHGGGLLARLKAQWPAIAGPDLAAATWPEALGPGGVLKLRVLPARALEVQHRAPLVIERVNLFFGRPVAARLALRQGELPLAPAPRAPVRTLSPEGAAALERRIAGIADAGLRTALAGLGRGVLAAPERDGE